MTSNSLVILLQVVFWTSFTAVFVSYIVYPFIIKILSKYFSKNFDFLSEYTPNVSLIISIYNESNIIWDCLLSIVESDYPHNKIQIILGSDGSTDETNVLLKKFKDEHPEHDINLFFLERSGKNSTLNSITCNATGDILLFMDADIRLKNDSIKILVSKFSDQKIGCVISPMHSIDQINDSQSQKLGHGFFKKYEEKLRKYESRLGYTASSQGAFYGIRNNLYKPLPNDLVCDDFAPVLEVQKKGANVIFDFNCLVFEVRDSHTNDEIDRRARIAAGALAVIYHYFELLNPKYGVLALELLLHKFIRYHSPIFLLLMLLSSISLYLFGSWLFKLLLMIQIFFYISAIVGRFLEKYNIKFSPFRVSYYFLLLNLGYLLGIIKLILRKKISLWSRD